MSLAIVRPRASSGLAAPAVTVEVRLSNGLPSFSIVGLPESVVIESRERGSWAVLHCRCRYGRVVHCFSRCRDVSATIDAASVCDYSTVLLRSRLLVDNRKSTGESQ